MQLISTLRRRWLQSVFFLLFALCFCDTSRADNIQEHQEFDAEEEDDSNLIWQGIVSRELEDDAAEDEGGFVWHDLSVNTTDGKDFLLHPSSGVLRNGQFTAILGPSGSGKTTFLTALAGWTATSSGFVTQFSKQRAPSNNTSSPPLPSNILALQPVLQPDRIGFLRQHDAFFAQLTVQETLQLAAFLELPFLSHADRHSKLLHTATQLGLGPPALYRTIGEPLSTHSHSRLSGGERRRLAVALQLLTHKQILLADEPTSGLDTTYATTVVQLLHTLARTRHIPVVAALHQPRSHVWRTWVDAVVLVAPGGRVCFAGPRSAVVPYMARQGHVLPEQSNPADFLVDLVSVDTENMEQAKKDWERIEELAVAFREYQREQGNEYKRKRNPTAQLPVVVLDPPSPASSWTKAPIFWWRWIPRLAALVQRTWRQNIRDRTVNVARALLSVANAVLMAGMFPTVRGLIPMVNSVTDRVALLSFAAIQICMLSYMKAVTLFAKERPVVARERYSVLEYILSKLLAEIPLDSVFAVLFATTLKGCTGLQIGWGPLSLVFSLTSIAGATMGYSLGSISPANEVYATIAGIPVLVVFMIVGVINPSGRDPAFPPPRLVQYIKEASPIVRTDIHTWCCVGCLSYTHT